ncbi:hypothetical protein [Pedobacter nyackensis]|uniref:hypothetical protein n=1 Tax=Pedobacter nyackensis TaxID=475255 RepID=UPI00292EB21F|nr:hypothetical protein [Pedobacter nyackensis]
MLNKLKKHLTKYKLPLSIVIAPAIFLISAGAVSKINNERELIAYLTKTIEADNLINPDVRYYKQKIKPEELPKYRLVLWDYWKQANKKRLATWPSLNNATTLDSVKWQLPDDKQMLFSISKKGEKPAAGYPLFINLHGGGTFPQEPGPWTSKANDREWLAAKTLGSRYDDAASLYFVPRMPDDRRGRWYHRAAATAWIRAWQLGVLSGDIDASRTYILGISEGGYGSFRMGIFFADYFAGAGPMAGSIWKEQEHIENLRNTAFFIGMGENDFAYDRITNARNWKIMLDSAASKNRGQFVHKVDIQAGKGHGIDYFKASPWLKQFKRKSYPDTLSMVYYAQCDTIYGGELNRPCTYRNGFGYVRLDGLSKTGERRFYIEKEANTYHINSDDIKGHVQGKIRLYIDRIDFKNAVKVNYNGKLVFNKKLTPNIGTMAESLALFGDPERIFPASVDLNVR